MKYSSSHMALYDWNNILLYIYILEHDAGSRSGGNVVELKKIKWNFTNNEKAASVKKETR